MTHEYSGENRRTPQRWSLKKEVSIGDLFAFVAAFSSVLYAYSTLNTRLSIIEDRQATQVLQVATLAAQQLGVDRRQDEDGQRAQARIDKSLDEINRKLDRLTERK